MKAAFKVGLLAACGVATSTALPEWSWDTIQTYVHCANFTGEWNQEALEVMAKQPFVVFEKYHKIFNEPVCDNAEDKIVASCKAVKALNPKTQCYMYTESDWARTEYSLGHWFDANPDSALQCPNKGDFIDQQDTVCASGKGSKDPSCFNYTYLAYDFNNSAAREKWIERVTNATSTGFVDGAFIDGNRGGFNSGVTSKCSPSKQEGWAAGLQLAISDLAQRLGPNKTLISNYPTPEALALCSGGMMERGGSSADIQAFGKKTCGPWNQPCLLDYHAQYFNNPSDGKMAGFLLGMQKYAYFGGGSGWGGPGEGACALWLKQFPEFTKALGAPDGDMVVTKASWAGATCDTSSKRSDTSGCLYARSFASGTRVFVGQYLAPDPASKPKNKGSCIYWSDGTTTSPDQRNCMPKHELF